MQANTAKQNRAAKVAPAHLNPAAQPGTAAVAPKAQPQGGAAPTPAVAPKVAVAATQDLRTIKVMVAANPKRPGTKAHPRFELYGKGGQTVAAYHAACIAAGHGGYTRVDIAWDLRHGFITLV